ncbi:hypothetical protein DY000_02023704 [Brassica cretica]|uniref:Uncharacterized protein n=1 Tax=Brassica cretica TaxID=69181 RepID=A0ABQ7E6P2_BRACR|nr:hypothetical protein DY000_02023704 [Brassica cretica]
MLNRLIHPVPSHTAAGSSSSGSRRVRSARAAVLKMADQTRTAKHVGRFISFMTHDSGRFISFMTHQLKAFGRPKASSTLKPPSLELHNVESLSLSLNVLGENRNRDLGLRVFKIPQVKPIPLSTRPVLNPSREVRNFAGLPNGGPIPPCNKPLRTRPAVQVLDCHP